jgi:hypothetical protein
VNRSAVVHVVGAVASCALLAASAGAQASVRPVDVWLACQHPRADTIAHSQLVTEDSAVRRYRRGLGAPGAARAPDTTTRAREDVVIARLEATFAANANLRFLCKSLVLPSGGTLARLAVGDTWASAWRAGSRLPAPDTVLRYARDAESGQRALWASLDTIAAMRRADFRPPLTLAVYFAPEKTEIDLSQQGANLQRLVDAIRNVLQSTTGSVTIEGRADYSGSTNQALSDSANERIARARARALKLAILQADNRIDETRLLTTVSVLKRTDALADAEQMIGGARLSGLLQPPAADRSTEIERDRVLNGIRAGYRASGVRISPAQLVAHAPIMLDTGALAAARKTSFAPGVTPTQWAVALTNVVAERAIASAQSLAFERAGRRLCEQRYASQFRSTCGLVQPDGRSVSDLRDWPTLDNLRSALRSDLAVLTPALVDQLLDVPTVVQLRARTDSALRAADAVRDVALRLARSARDSSRANAARAEVIARIHRVDSATAELVNTRGPDIWRLRAILRSTQVLARRLDAGASPLDAVTVLREPLGLPAVDSTPFARTLRQVAGIAAEYTDAERTLLAARLQGAARPDTLLLYAARTLAVNTRQDSMALRIAEILDRGMGLVVAASALDSVVRAA